MKIEITPSKIQGCVSAPASKSLSHRAIIAAALARGTSTISNVLLADDTKQTILGLRQMGVSITQHGSTLSILGSGGNLVSPLLPIDVGSSGTTLRMLTAISAIITGKTTLTGNQRICERPMHDLLRTLKAVGASATSHNGFAPIEVTGGELEGGNILINGDVSSQFISAICFIAPFAQKETRIIMKNVRSSPYIDLTVQTLIDFGISVHRMGYIIRIPPGQRFCAKNIVIEGDFSSASYIFAAAAVTGSSVTVTNLNPNSLQGDRHILALLTKMGCTVNIHSTDIRVTGPKTLSAITVDMKDHPDIVQSIAAVAAFAHGTTTLTNIGHLKHKETDRLTGTVSELRKMNIDATSDESSITIVGGKPMGAIIDTRDDHRMAMSFAVAGLATTGKTVITDAEVVNKSHPEFFSDLAKIGGHLKEII